MNIVGIGPLIAAIGLPPLAPALFALGTKVLTRPRPEAELEMMCGSAMGTEHKNRIGQANQTNARKLAGRVTSIKKREAALLPRVSVPVTRFPRPAKPGPQASRGGSFR